MGKKFAAFRAFRAFAMGVGLFGWSGLRLVGGELRLGRKYSPDSRNSGDAPVVAFVEVEMFLNGAWGIVRAWRDRLDAVEPTSERREDRQEVIQTARGRCLTRVSEIALTRT